MSDDLIRRLREYRRNEITPSEGMLLCREAADALAAMPQEPIKRIGAWLSDPDVKAAVHRKAPRLPTREEIASVLRTQTGLGTAAGFEEAADRVLSLFTGAAHD